MNSPSPVRVFIDGCAVNRFALINVDPAKTLAATEFMLSVTPELETEYRRGLDHVFVPSYVKAMLHALLERCEHHGTDHHPGRAADRRLIDLSRAALVITDDAKLYRRWPGPGMIAWPDVEAFMKTEGTLADLLRSRAGALPST